MVGFLFSIIVIGIIITPFCGYMEGKRISKRER